MNGTNFYQFGDIVFTHPAEIKLLDVITEEYMHPDKCLVQQTLIRWCGELGGTRHLLS